MAYEEMKATKNKSNADKAKEAISSALGGLTKNKSSGSKKSTSSSKKTSQSTSKSKTGSSKFSTKSSTTSTRKTSKKEPTIIGAGATIAAAVIGSKNKSKKKGKNSSQGKNSKSALTMFLVILFFATGFVGCFLATNILCKNDIYEMVTYSNGQADITIGETEEFDTYTELGVKCVAFGKDHSSDYSVTYFFRNNLTETEEKVERVGEKGEGIYYAVYSANTLKYKTVKLVRNIIVLRGEDDEAI